VVGELTDISHGLIIAARGGPMKILWLSGISALLVVSLAAQTTNPSSSIPAVKDASAVPALMLAVQSEDAAAVEQLLKRGADPNEADAGGATALMWAIPDIEKARRLVAAGANVNARSTDLGRTPLLVAANYPGTVEVLKLLLAHGADLHAKDATGFTALGMAMLSSDVEVVRFLVEKGLDPNDAGPVVAQRSAYGRQRPAVVEYLMARGLKVAADSLTVNWQRPELIARWIEMGGDVNAKVGPYGGTPLMRSVSSELATADTVQLLLERGANANAESTEGERPLDWAIYRGDRAKIAVLEKYGATRGRGPRQEPAVAPPAGSRDNDPRSSVARSVSLLLKTAPPMFQQRRCYTCHHNTVPAEAAALARSKGIPVPEDLARKNLDDILAVLRTTAGPAMQGRQLVPGGVALTVGYGLMALAAERYPLDPMIASHIHWTLATQMPDGSWLGNGVNRPPAESSTVSHTVIAVRALALYPIPARKPEFDRALRRAGEWLVKAEAPTAEDRAMKLMGLVWTKAPQTAVKAAIQAIVQQQAGRGGWSQLPDLEPDAYATGLSLVALHEAGMRVNDDVYRKGIDFLLTTQHADGSWLVRTRAFPVQPYFESGFPFDRHQWISAAGTAWAAKAIALTLQTVVDRPSSIVDRRQ
jgi:ankyrin repeat protein